MNTSTTQVDLSDLTPAERDEARGLAYVARVVGTQRGPRLVVVLDTPTQPETEVESVALPTSYSVPCLGQALSERGWVRLSEWRVEVGSADALRLVAVVERI